MGNLINRKKEKCNIVFSMLGENVEEEEFIKKYKELYYEDWNIIQRKFEEEEKDTSFGKKHPMPHPDLYMKEMFRNAKSRINRKS